MHIEEVYVRVVKKYMRSVLSYFWKSTKKRRWVCTTCAACCFRYTWIYDNVIASTAFMHIEEVYVRVVKKYMRSVRSYIWKSTKKKKKKKKKRGRCTTCAACCFGRYTFICISKLLKSVINYPSFMYWCTYDMRPDWHAVRRAGRDCPRRWWTRDYGIYCIYMTALRLCMTGNTCKPLELCIKDHTEDLVGVVDLFGYFNLRARSLSLKTFFLALHFQIFLCRWISS